MSLLKNSSWNLLSSILPNLIAIPIMGIMVRQLGVEKFGIFTLAFTIIGYSSIFDAGMTRAVIHAVALHRDNKNKSYNIMTTASTAILIISAAVSIVLWLNIENIVSLLKISDLNYSDSILAFRWLVVAIPPFLLGITWLSYLEGNERFKQLSIIKSIVNPLVVILPLVAVFIQNSLFSAVVGLIIARVIIMCCAYIPLKKDVPRFRFGFDVTTFKELFHFGGWVTISNIISPLMVNFDRFIVSNIAGAQTVAFYVAPADAVAKMSMLPRSVSSSLFPALSSKTANANKQIRQAYQYILIISAIVIIPIFILAEYILTLWLGPEFSGDAASVFRILLVGYFFNSFAVVPYAIIQAEGHSRVTALIHLFELVPYLFLLFWLVSHYSIIGAAAAWSIRVTADYLILLYYSRRV